MLIVDDSAKEILDQNKIPYGVYNGTNDAYLTSVLNAALESAIKYNDGDVNDKETVDKYVAFIKNTKTVERSMNKMDKLFHDIINIVCEITEGKHEEIMNLKTQEEKE